MKCTACGAQITSGSRFCGQCGAAAPTALRCANCGEELRPGAAFCTNCGTSSPQAASQSPAAPDAPALSAVPVPSPEPQAAAEEAAPPTPREAAIPRAPATSREAEGRTENGGAPSGLSPATIASSERTKKQKGNGSPRPSTASTAIEYKGVAPRFFATLIDIIIYAVVTGLLAWKFGSTSGSLSSGVNFQFALEGWPAAAEMAIFSLYVLLMEGFLGGTLGKLILDMRVVNGGGRRPGLSAALIRNVLRIIDVLPVFYILGIILVVATKRKQRVGDMVARTYVVSRRGAKELRTTGGVAKAPNSMLAVVLLVLMLVLVAGGIYAFNSGAVVLPKIALP